MAEIKDCLIVAAGQGTRIKGLGRSKPLIELAGTPLIEHAIQSAASSGIENFVVVTGYRADELTSFLQQLSANNGWNISTVFNPDFLKENGLSVLAAAPLLQNDFYLCMCDHLVEPEIYSAMAAAKLKDGEVGLGVDYRLNNPMVDIDDVTKVDLQNGVIRNIGKEIPRYNAYDTGIFRGGQSLFNAIRQNWQQTGDCSISGGMKLFAQQGKAIGIDIKAAEWIDVDSEQMHQMATKWLAKRLVS
ncbi:MAG: NTP transferase domain-containing protein [Robiginitomaculum sp.]|nr:NTP transferase domain-containing protein [Robiginitomaculum sp.]